VTLREVDTADNESKVRKNYTTNNYSAYLTCSESTLIEVKPDDDYDDVQFNDIVVVEDTHVIIEKLKAENLEKEKRIQELLRQNMKLKPFRCGRRHVKNKPTKFRDKINDIRNSTTTSDTALEIRCRTSRIDNSIVLPQYNSEPLMFRMSLKEAKEQREKNFRLEELGEKSDSWEFSEFTLL